MINKQDVVSLQKKLQDVVEIDLNEQIRHYPEKSTNANFALLNEASVLVQQAIAKLGKVIESQQE